MPAGPVGGFLLVMPEKAVQHLGVQRARHAQCTGERPASLGQP
ncbi:MAG TPA: hypothetical protein VIL00_01770 [Pseudonocardiaceae bacterium]